MALRGTHRYRRERRPRITLAFRPYCMRLCAAKAQMASTNDPLRALFGARRRDDRGSKERIEGSGALALLVS